jgi:hypothetical protein
MNLEKFNFIRDNYGLFSSWAVWEKEGKTPKSNVGNLNVLDPNINDELLRLINTKYVMVGLNISRGAIKIPFANFHDKRSEATDFKIRYAFNNTKAYGAYMTDLIKDYDEKSSASVKDYLKKNKQFLASNLNFFKNEIEEIGNVEILIAFGADVYSHLLKTFSNQYRIIKVPHYANYCSKEQYRREVREALGYSKILDLFRASI